ncbi:MAG: S41 family peptidase [Planctomycetota bacterium]|nr:S41 family peptidase [Planctomycetota bacterium]
MQFSRFSQIKSITAAIRVRRAWIFVAIATILFAARNTSDYHVAAAESELRFVDSENSLATVLQHGANLEKQEKWAEALSHYENAIKRFPNDKTLRGHQDLARIHYDLDRRYDDSSYRATIKSLSAQQAGELYGEVLAKMETYFVNPMDWQKLVNRGTRCLEIALRKGVLTSSTQSVTATTAFEQTLTQLKQFIQQRPVSNREEAIAVVAATAVFAATELGLSQSAVLLEYVAGASGGLDNYSCYLTGNQLKDVYSQIDGNFVGIGIELKAENQTLLIVSVIPGSPAAKAGIRAGDRILSVDGTSTHNLSTDAAAGLLQGPKNSRLEMSIHSPQQQPRDVSLVRQHVEVPSVDGVCLIDEDQKIGYLRLISFQRSTSRELDEALWKLYHQGMKSLVIDVRSNPGGLLSASVDIADKFVPQGTIVSTRGRSPQEDFDYPARRSSTWELPLVVLVDENSASASEIFAAAVHDHQRATLVGRKSYGKGSVQGIFPLARCGAGLRLTTAKFYSPNGQPISKVGVKPDIVVHQTKKPVMMTIGTKPLPEQDPILRAGIDAARQKVAAR